MTSHVESPALNRTTKADKLEGRVPRLQQISNPIILLGELITIVEITIVDSWSLELHCIKYC